MRKSVVVAVFFVSACVALLIAQSTIGRPGAGSSRLGRLGQTGSTIFKHWLASFGNAENKNCTSNTDASCFSGTQTDGPAQLPTHGIYTGIDGTPSPGAVVTFTCGSSLQTTLNSLTAGETLKIPATCSGSQDVLSGNFTLPAIAGADAAHWVTIETDQLSNPNFPAEHGRITPCAINMAVNPFYPIYPCPSPAFLVPQITCTSGQCWQYAPGANFYRIIGVEFYGNPSINNSMTVVDHSGSQSNHVIYDRVIVHGPALNCTLTGASYTCSDKDVAHGIAFASSTYGAVVNSYVYDILCPNGSCTDATGIGLGGNASVSEDVKKLYNNFIAAAGEAYFAGGGGSGTATLTPNDFEIRNNHTYKPVSWLLCVGGSGSGCGGAHPEVKNNGELKNANRVLIEGNIYENNWSSWQTDQAGFDSLLTPKNQSSKTNVSATSDSTGTVLTGSFPSIVVDPNCATPNHCQITFSGVITQAQTWTATSVTVSPAVTASTSATASVCQVGLNPNATDTNVTYRFNQFLNAHNGIQLGAGTSDCSDKSSGIAFVSIHDNLFTGINYLNGNQHAPGTGEQCVEFFNGQKAPNNIHDVSYFHNTCILATGHANSFVGDFVLDGTASTNDGSTGSYFTNFVDRDNLGVAGGLIGYRAGSIYPGGESAGLAQIGCTPPVSGTTCTWVFTHNVLGEGLWTGQTNNTPFPSTNQTCGGATCFPSGSTFTSIFNAFNGPNGQPGYLGDYHIAAGSPYLAAGTDGKNIGADIDAINAMSQGVASPTNYTAASITTLTFPAGTHGTAYTQPIQAAQASDFQYFSVSSGSLPPGIQLQQPGSCGVSNPSGWCLVGTPTTAGSYTFTLQLYDAAQQYATQSYTLTIN